MECSVDKTRKEGEAVHRKVNESEEAPYKEGSEDARTVEVETWPSPVDTNKVLDNDNS